VSAGVVVFNHGKDSEPWGYKIQALAKVAESLHFAVESVDYRGIDSIDGRLERLLAVCAALAPAVLVGSSLGGYLAAAASQRVKARGLFLMAPAFDLPPLPPLPEVAACPTVVVHGWRDEIVPLDRGFQFAKRQQALLHVVDDDHRLHASLPSIEGWLRDFLRTLPSVPA
jgi:pimeloyl-ACP methyl ester carboxylesterase